MDKHIILVGGGGHAKVVLECARSSGLDVVGFLDDREDAALESLEVLRLGPINEWERHFEAKRHLLFNAIGDNGPRERAMQIMIDSLSKEPADIFASIVHASAVVSDSARIEPGVLVAPGAVVNAASVISQGAIINSGAIVEHDCRIDEYAHVAPGSVLGGSVRVGKGTLVGLGARVLPGIRIGEGATIAAGAVVVQDIPNHATVRGVPAK